MDFSKAQYQKAVAGDGTAINYARWQGGGGKSSATLPRVALLHSLAMDHSFWAGVVEHFGDDIDVIAIDARGHGRSDMPAGPYTVDLFADDLKAVFEHAQWSSAIVAGASMGGSVSQAFAARHPRCVDGLVLIDTTATYGVDAIKAWEARGQKAVDGGMKAMIEFQTSRWFSEAFAQASPDLVDESLAVFLKNDPARYIETCRMLGNCDVSASLPGFDMPVSIVVGEEDYATPVAMAEAMRDAIPDSTLKVVRQARHYTPIEVPMFIAREIRSVITRVQDR